MPSTDAPIAKQPHPPRPLRSLHIDLDWRTHSSITTRAQTTLREQMAHRIPVRLFAGVLFSVRATSEVASVGADISSNALNCCNMYCPWLFQYLALIYRAILPKHILFYFFSLVWLAYLRYQPHKFHLLTPSGAASYNECRCRPHAYILYGVVAVRVRCTSSLAALLGSKYLGWQPSVKRAQVAKDASS